MLTPHELIGIIKTLGLPYIQNFHLCLHMLNKLLHLFHAFPCKICQIAQDGCTILQMHLSTSALQSMKEIISFTRILCRHINTISLKGIFAHMCTCLGSVDFFVLFYTVIYYTLKLQKVFCWAMPIDIKHQLIKQNYLISHFHSSV